MRRAEHQQQLQLITNKISAAVHASVLEAATNGLKLVSIVR